MAPQELRYFKIALLDEIWELSTDPVADPEPVKQKIEDFFGRLEAVVGKNS